MSGSGTHTAVNTSIREAPKRFWGIVKELGPGLIIAGSVVGSGELIATTVAGAEAGFWLLWVILIGCFIKVFVQLEIGKFTILTGKTTLGALGELPGLRVKGMHWIAWLCMFMFLGVIGQMGGIVGGVGQAFSLAMPITEKGLAYNEASDAMVRAQLAEVDGLEIGEEITESIQFPKDPGPDIYIWAVIIALGTAIILYLGRYDFIEKSVVFLVVGFTVMSLVNLLMLQQTSAWAFSWSEFAQGLQFKLPPSKEGLYPLATALAAFGIIGMAAGELIFYPYWCLEKGYAKYVGAREEGESWERRAHGWIRVMKYDAWGSMVVYTLSTVAFYLLGASVLSRAGLHPEGLDMIRTLSAMYEPVFGEASVGLFLFGAVVVLYSTFFVNNASSAYVWADAVHHVRGDYGASHSRYSTHRFFCVFLPLLSFVMYCLVPKPKGWIIFAGMMQTMLLPVLGYVAIKYRFFSGAKAFRTRKAGDIFIFVSAFALLLAGAWLLLSLIFL